MLGGVVLLKHVQGSWPDRVAQVVFSQFLVLVLK